MPAPRGLLRLSLLAAAFLFAASPHAAGVAAPAIDSFIDKE